MDIDFVTVQNVHIYYRILSLFFFLALLFGTTFRKGIYNYIPETNHASRVYNFAAILYLKFMLHVMSFPMSNVLYFYISTFQSRCAVPNMAVFCSFLNGCFLGMLLRYFLSNFEMVPAVPIITGITFVFTFHMWCISFVRSVYFKIFSASFILFQSQLTYMFLFHFPRLWCPVYCLAWFCSFALVDSIICLPYLHDLFQLILVHGHTSVHCLFTPIYLHMLKCSSAHIL